MFGKIAAAGLAVNTIVFFVLRGGDEGNLNVRAAVLHVVGSMIVVFNSARLVRQGEELEPFQVAASANPPSTGGTSTRAPEAHEHLCGATLLSACPAPPPAT